MGGATKIFTLSTAPLLLYNRRFLLRAAFSFGISNVLFSPRNFASLSPFPSHRQGFGGIRALRRCLHTQYALRDNRFSDPNEQGAPLTWPEWSRFIDCLASCGYFNRNDGAEDGFTSVDGLPEEFLRAARCCLAFARDRPDVLRLLWRKDVETITENGAPFLFKNGDESAWRMRSFLSSRESNVLASDMAQTLDLMRFLLSYMSKPTLSLEGGATFNNDFVGSSVRHLLNELIQVIHTVPGSNGSASAARQYPRQTSRPQGENIEMKRGGWICPSTGNFMNFERNMKCLECEEARPKRQLTSGEWECPQCDFGSRPAFGFGNNNNFNKDDSGLAPEENKEERWVKKASSIDCTSDMNNVIADKGYPEIMPLRKGVNRFVVSPRKTPLEKRLVNFYNEGNLGHDQNLEWSDSQAAKNNLNATFSICLDELLDRTSAHSDTHYNSSNSDVGMPPVYSRNVENLFGSRPAFGFGNDSNFNKGDSGLDPEEDKEELWFRKASSIDCTTDMNNVIADKDFPEIMPLSIGVNRFVVSSRKTPLEKRLVNFRNQGSLGHDQNLSLEGGGTYNYDFVGTFVRHLLNELNQVIYTVPGVNGSASAARQYLRQASRPQGENIEMKRDGWICPRCNFMNFEKNMKCLECEEARPKRKLTSGEWECPQCKFINFARNMKCLECEAARPKRQRISGQWKMPPRNGANNNLNATFSRGLDEFLGRTSAHSEPHNNSSNSDAGMPPVYSRNVENLFSSRTTFGFGKNSNLNKGDSGLALDEDEEERWFKEASCIDTSTRDFNKGDSGFALDDDEEERWFKKASSIGSTSYLNKGDSALAPDKDEEERWFKKASSMDSTGDMNNVIPVKDFPEIMPHPECHDSQAADNNLYATFSRGLDELLCQTATHSETHKNSSDSVAGLPPVAGPPSQQFCPPQGNSSSYVPFVTLPLDMFEKIPQSSEMPERGNVVTNNYKNVDVSGSKDYGTLGSLADRGKEQN